MTVLYVVAAVAAVAFGLYLGLPDKHGNARPRRDQRWRIQPEDIGEHDPQRLQELEQALGRSGRSRKAKRHFTPLDLLKTRKRGSQLRGGRRYFRTAAPSRRSTRSRSSPSDTE